ncbi:MAG: nucleoside hydrolase [Micrococcaceae bacterium]
MTSNPTPRKPENFTPTRLIVDTDGGVDDCVAALVACNLDGIEVQFTSVGGNVSAEQAAQNIAQVTGRRVHCGGDPPGWVPESRHGVDGIHGAWDQEIRLTTSDGVAVLTDALQRPGTAIACLGPLTNLATAIQTVGGIESVDEGIRIVALGGVEGGPEGLRDTNVGLDQQAADMADPVIEWVTLPQAAHLSATSSSFAAHTPAWSFIEKFAHRTEGMWHSFLPQGEFPLYDAAIVTTAAGCADSTGRMIRDALEPNTAAMGRLPEAENP